MNFPRVYLIGLTLALSACATHMPSDKYMDDDGNTVEVSAEGRQHNPDIVRVVKYEQFRNMLIVKREAGSEANGHPLSVTAEQLAQQLKHIKIRRYKDSRPQPLFDNDHPQELNQFSEWLAAALGNAGPDEDILFHFTQNRGLGLISENTMTVGRAFVKDGKINIIFSSIQGQYEGLWLRMKILRRFPVPLRAKPGLEDGEVVESASAPRKTGRSDWVVLDAAPATARPQAGNAPTPAAPQLRPAEERLLKLQELKNKGLISEEEFQLKRREILQSI